MNIKVIGINMPLKMHLHPSCHIQLKNKSKQSLKQARRTIKSHFKTPLTVTHCEVLMRACVCPPVSLLSTNKALK